MMKNCGNCANGRMLKEDFTKRICRGAPPQVVLVAAGVGKVQMQFHWPMVDAQDEGCGMHKAKVIIDDGVIKDV